MSPSPPSPHTSFPTPQHHGHLPHRAVHRGQGPATSASSVLPRSERPSIIMDPGQFRPTPSLFVNENESPAVEGRNQRPAAGETPRATIEQQDEPIPQRAASQQSQTPHDLTTSYLPSLNADVDDDEIWPTLRKAYAKIYWQAANILQVRLEPNTPESKHRDELRVYARAIKTISEPEFRKQSAKEWPKLPNTA
ncbi:hypothetical protein LTR78_002036 [Recurvomyces mirabilis]|uniref:Uncharacterized protein n=1 Tax=Recurvomyces mirabilis TaxID=574656 RepID=A0AAE1C4K2_9PEZI|nr:hypothetical protein LTR78_002036 [Recurvomyces mirabilis]KAK5160494.1 hypothetical protein LTS14_001506 [Recurvomyces mirabilis]